MAQTLVEASKLATSPFEAAVIETVVKDDPLLLRMGFRDITGNALTYVRRTTESAAEFYAVNEPLVHNEPGYTPYTATTKILISAAELDDYLKRTRSNEIDLQMDLVKAASKALKEKFGDYAVYGSVTSNSKAFDGLHVLIADSTYNSILIDGSDTAAVALSMARVDQAIDTIKGFKPACILSSKGLKRNVTKYLRGVSALSESRDEFGMPVITWGGLPWYGSDFIVETELTSSGAFSAKTGGYTTSIFVLSFESGALEGVQTGNIEVIPWRAVPGTNKDELVVRWYVGLMMESLVASCKITGIDADGTVTA